MNMKKDDASNIQLAVVFTVVVFAIVCGCVFPKKKKRKIKERKMTNKEKRENKVFQNQTTISAISMEDETEMNRKKYKTDIFTVEFHKTKINQNRDTLSVEDETKIKITKSKAASFTSLGVEHLEQVNKKNNTARSLPLLTDEKKTKTTKHKTGSMTSCEYETKTKKMKSQAVSSTSLQDETQTQIKRDKTISSTSLKHEIKKMKTTNQVPSSTSLAEGTKIARDQATSSTSLENRIKTQESINQATSTTSLTKEEKMKETKNQATSTTSLVNGTKSTKRKHDSSKSTNHQVMVSINLATSTTSLTNEEQTNETNNQAKPTASLVNETKGSKEKESTPKGLLNMGNTCFMNAMLQNIAWCPKLQTELQKANLNKVCKMSKSVLKILKYTHSEEKNHKFPGYEPSDILSAARERNSIFDGYQQQDSFEMFNTIIDAIKEEMLNFIQKNDSNVDGQSEEEQFMNKPTGVRLFFGTFVTEYDYSSCEHIECVFQRFSSMTVPIVETSEKERYRGRKDKNKHKWHEQQSSFEGLTGIERGLKDGLMKKEIFDEEIFSCRKCDKRRTDGKCEKTMLIYEAPSIMVLHIDRFRENYHGGMVKRNDKVTYPETLNIGEFCSKTMKVHGKDQPLSYSLFGVVAHSGSLSSGHYVAYIKTKQRSTASWYDYMKTTWNDPEKCKEEVERKLEELKENESAHQCTSDNGFTETTIKRKTKLHSKNSWFYISDAFVRMCKYEEAMNNQNAYVLLYEKM